MLMVTMVMLMLVAVRVKMMVVSLMVAMVTSMGSPFAFSLANLPVFPKQQYVALHWMGGDVQLRVGGGNCILMIRNLLLQLSSSLYSVPRTQ